jgi:general L-amino acid transport system permease protein
MRDRALAPAEATTLVAPPSGASAGAVLRALVGTPLNLAITLACAALIGLVLASAVRWLAVDGVLTGDPATCKATSGACWPFLAEKLRFALFGFFPYDQHWRPLATLALMLALIALTMWPRAWRPWLLAAWAGGIAAMLVLMGGGVLGLAPVATRQWGGLPVTFILAVVGFGLAFPLGILLALGRRSQLPAIRVIATLYIELIRGVPLISLLFMASVMLPLFLPRGWTIDALLRAQVAIVLFAAAYIAEVVRGGLQGIDKGQMEAAQALGLGYWRMMGLVVLPQALKIVIPPMVTTFIGFFQDTTLVTIVGLFDFLSSVRAALRDPAWQGIAVLEGYLFAAVVYFAFCWGLGLYSRWLERRLDTGHR